MVFQLEWLLLNVPPKLGSYKYLAHRLFLLGFLGPAPKSSTTSGGTSSTHCCSSRRPKTRRLLLRAPCILSPAHSGLLLCVDFATWSREVSHLWRDRDPSWQQPGLIGLMVIQWEPNLGESLNLSFLIIKMGIEVPLLPKVKWDHVRVQTAMFESLLCKNYFLWKRWFLLKHLGVCLLPPSSQNCFSHSEPFLITDWHSLDRKLLYSS